MNFILRDDFEGSETTVHLGGSSDGGAAERQFSQLLGKSWSGGNVLLNLEHFEKEALYANQRKVSESLLDPSTLLPKLSRRSEEHTSELQSLMRNSYAVFCLKKK